MNRAIGAIDKTAGVNSFGMHYQWGRKDPFTPSTSTSPTNNTPGGKDTQLYNETGTPINTNTYGIGGEWTNSTTKASNITALTSKPSTFYGTRGDIVTTPAGASWWNPTTKTLYDPCPSGYRIPEIHTYGHAGTDVINNTGWGLFQSIGLNSGINWQIGSSFFPASGFRNSANGYFNWVGSYGFAWISTPHSTTNGYGLHFVSGAVYPNLARYRSYGWPLRCISE